MSVEASCLSVLAARSPSNDVVVFPSIVEVFSRPLRRNLDQNEGVKLTSLFGSEWRCEDILSR